MRATLILAAVLSTACGDGLNDRPLETFGDGSLLISEAFCEASFQCGQRIEGQYPYCVDSQAYQLCNGFWDCSVAITLEQAEKFVDCGDSFSEWDCTGSFSDVCIEVLQFED